MSHEGKRIPQAITERARWKKRQADRQTGRQTETQTLRFTCGRQAPSRNSSANSGFNFINGSDLRIVHEGGSQSEMQFIHNLLPRDVLQLSLIQLAFLAYFGHRGSWESHC